MDRERGRKQAGQKHGRYSKLVSGGCRPARAVCIVLLLAVFGLAIGPGCQIASLFAAELTAKPTITIRPTVALAPTPTPSPTPSPTSTPVPVDFDSSFDFQPLAIMVENQIDARPQSGLNTADVIYEAVTEAGITRFMAIYANQNAEVVGPVRSCRHYYVYWASEYNAIYSHFGASPQGYDAIAATGINTIDAIRGEGYFWRSEDREAPHNAYTGISELRDTSSDAGEGWLGGLHFSEYDTKASTDQVREIKLVHPDEYTVAYDYSEEDNAYLRFMEGYPHVDAWDGIQYAPKNVIVAFVNTWRIPGDTAGRVDMELVGRGEAYVFTGGKVVEASWVKEGWTTPTRYIDIDGNDIVLNPGQTWIQIVPDGGSVSYE